MSSCPKNFICKKFVLIKNEDGWNADGTKVYQYKYNKDGSIEKWEDVYKNGKKVDTKYSKVKA
ncbi:hypothetical protein IJG14_05405 [bacterium]|nr:hypothetical protein [bacterium]